MPANCCRTPLHSDKPLMKKKKKHFFGFFKKSLESMHIGILLAFAKFVWKVRTATLGSTRVLQVYTNLRYDCVFLSERKILVQIDCVARPMENNSRIRHPFQSWVFLCFLNIDNRPRTTGERNSRCVGW